MISKYEPKGENEYEKKVQAVSALCSSGLAGADGFRAADCRRRDGEGRSSQEKIDPALWDVLLAADEETLIPIDISLYDLDENTLSEKVELETGLDPEVFRDEARFEKEIASKLRTAAQTAFREETSYKASAKRLSDQAFAKLKTALSDDWGQWIDDASLEDIREIEPEKIVDRLILEIRSEFQFKQNEILRAGTIRCQLCVCNGTCASEKAIGFCI